MQKAYLLSLALLINLSANLIAAQKNALSIKQLAGSWLSKEYVETLKATKDPMKAISKVADACSLYIFKPDSDYFYGHYTRAFGYNFHEGGSSPIILDLKPADNDFFFLIYGEVVSTKGPKTPVKMVPSISDERVRIISRTSDAIQEIEWSKRIFNDVKKIEWQKAEFIKVEKDTMQYVNKIVLAGKYKDQQDRPFVFTDSIAVWPERTFHYAVQRDFVEGWPTGDCQTFDVLDDKDRSITGKNGFPERLGYRWKDKTLYIYNLSYPKETGEIVCGKDPVFVLTPKL